MTFGAGDDVVALARRDRDEAGRLDAQAAQIAAILLGDRAEAVGAVADQVHLVDHDRDLPDAQQVEQVAVAVGLLAHALLGVDQQQRGLAAGRAGDHVLEELLVAGRIDDDVVARIGAGTGSGRCRSSRPGRARPGARPSGRPIRTACRAARRPPGSSRACRRAASPCRGTAGRPASTCRDRRGRRSRS